jgi:chemotaxis signal transduction protein
VPHSRTYVHVRAGAEHYALDVEHVLEIVELGAITPVPGSRGGVLGVHVLRGEVIAAASLAAALGIAHDETPHRLVVATTGDARRVGLAVDGIVGVGLLEVQSNEPEGEFVLATGMVDDALVGFLDVPALFDAIAGAEPS